MRQHSNVCSLWKDIPIRVLLTPRTAAFTRTLTCLLKYGDDLTIYAAPDSLSLSATNSSLSAYSRFRYERQFFVNYSVGEKRVNSGSFARDVEEVQIVTGQLLTKAGTSLYASMFDIADLDAYDFEVFTVCSTK